MSPPKNTIVVMPIKLLQENYKKYLHGDVQYLEEHNLTAYFIKDYSSERNDKTIGTWRLHKLRVIKSWLNISYRHKKLNIDFGSDTPNELQYKTVILYEQEQFDFNTDEDIYWLHNKIKETPLFRINQVADGKCLLLLMTLLNLVSNIVNKAQPIIKYSAVGTHLKATVDRLVWGVSLLNNLQFRIKVLNFFLSVIFDVVLGSFLLNFLLSVTSTEEFPKLFLWISESCVDYFRNLLKWLAGSPAGFKLNGNFNNILAQFYMFHTEIWWLFLVYISPVLSVAFQIFTFLGRFGVTFQAAILSDILALVSFHVYCIYAYAARLYNIQLSGLLSLWRLFLGRKWNPLREKVDSCLYSTDQLFVGTLAFTILLFLMPTTLIYYIVFATTRIIIVALGGILTRLQIFLHAIPIYAAILWCFGASAICTQILLKRSSLRSQGVIPVYCCKIPLTFKTAMKNSKPDCISIPEAIPVGIFHKIIFGQLLYPV